MRKTRRLPFGLAVLVGVFATQSAALAVVRPAGAATAAQDATVRVVQTAVIVAEPRGDADVVGTVTPGAVLELLDERGSWYLVRPPDDTPRDWRTGWINRAMVELLTVETPTTPRIPPAATQAALEPQLSQSGGTYPRSETSVGWSLLHDSTLDRTSALGVYVAGATNFTPWVGVAVEAGWNVLSLDAFGVEFFDASIFTALAGPRFTSRAVDRVVPFGQLLAGVAFTRFDVFGFLSDDVVFALQPGGGVDVVLTDRVALRFGVDSRMLFDLGQTFRELRFTTGVTFRSDFKPGGVTRRSDATRRAARPRQPVATAPSGVQHSVSLNVGYFMLQEDVVSDLIFSQLQSTSAPPHSLDSFNAFSGGADWLIAFGEHVEAGFGLGYYSRTISSVYRDFLSDGGAEIPQEFALRVIPVTATARFYLGRGAVQPYAGGGVGVFNWRYSEVGDFIDFNTLAVFEEEFVADGNDLGGVFLAGVRIPAGAGAAVGGEIRYQQVEGHLGPNRPANTSERIDLTGLTTQFTLQVKF